MTDQTVKSLHDLRMNADILMAILAEPCDRQKFMQFCPMAFGTFNSFAEKVLAVTDCTHNPSCPCNPFPQEMTLAAILKRDDDLAMPGRNGFRTVTEEVNEHLYSFDIGRIMAFMTVNTFVGTLRPLSIGRVHQVACLAKCRVVFRVIVCFVAKACGNKYGGQHDDQDAESIGYFSQLLFLI